MFQPTFTVTDVMAAVEAALSELEADDMGVEAMRAAVVAGDARLACVKRAGEGILSYLVAICLHVLEERGDLFVRMGVIHVL